MKRRSFLKLLGGAAVAATAPGVAIEAAVKPEIKKSAGVADKSSLGLAEIKQEGVVVKSEFGNALWPGAEKYYKASYDTYSHELAKALAESMRETQKKVVSNVKYGF